MPNLDPNPRIAAEELKEFKTVTPNSEFRCDDGTVRTWSEMVDGIDPDLAPEASDIPDDERASRYHELLWSFGAQRIS